MRQVTASPKSVSIPTGGFGASVAPVVCSGSVGFGSIGFVSFDSVRVAGFCPVSGFPVPPPSPQENSGRSRKIQRRTQRKLCFFIHFSPFREILQIPSANRLHTSVSIVAQTVCFLVGLTYLHHKITFFSAIIPIFRPFVNCKKRVVYYKNRNPRARFPKT